jgi:endonuclease/exonuclease/phosphatase family metal-dependent hydrolase
MDAPTLRLFTFNLVRSTRVPLPAWLVPAPVKVRTHALLDALLEEAAPDVVALQEVDAASAGRLRFGAHRVGAPDEHGSYLASACAITDPKAARFVRQGVSRDKGFASAVVRPSGFSRPVRVVSVHLDPAMPTRRRAQAEQLARTFPIDRDTHTILLGDFNEDAIDGAGIAVLEERLGLRTERAPHPTYDFLGVRKHLDWVFVSPGLALVEQRVMPIAPSDHRPVVAVVREALS